MATVNKLPLPDEPVDGDYLPRAAARLASCGASYLACVPNGKKPQGQHDRLDAVPADQFFRLKHENYGIRLDGWAVVADIDRPDCDTARSLIERLDATSTWSQKTKKGRHYLFLLTPGAKVRSSKLREPSGEVFGEILAQAYIVGPGSRIDGEVVYVCDHNVDPVEAPAWLIEYAQESARNDRTNNSTTSSTVRRDVIPYGEHDDKLHSIMTQMARSSANLGEQALTQIANYIANESGLLEHSDGYDNANIARHVRSALNSATRTPSGATTGSGCFPRVGSRATTSTAGRAKTKYLVPGMIAGVGFSIGYGDGKVDKSSWLAWVAAEITKRGHGVIFVPSGETTFEEFVCMVALYEDEGADASLVYGGIDANVYDKYYDWTSGFMHANWAAVRDAGLDLCLKLLHRLHRVVSIVPQALPSVTRDALMIVQGILDDLEVLYPGMNAKI